MKRSPKWKIKRTRDGQFVVMLIAANGEPRAWSESYTRRPDAVRAWRGIVADSLAALMPSRPDP